MSEHLQQTAKSSPLSQELTFAELGIVELDTRLDLSVDPFLKALISPAVVVDSNGSNCTVVVNTAC